MIVLLSPAKIQNFKSQTQVTEFSLPLFLSKSEKLIHEARSLSISGIANLLKVNFKIAEQTYNHHFQWHKNHTPENAKQAAWVFNGEAYRGLDIATFTDDDIQYAQNHLCIFSGLYGMLRPLDLIKPYRMDVGDETEKAFGINLYDFWGKEVNKTLTETLKNDQESNVMLNLMSKEYAKLIDRKKIGARVIDVDFLEYQPDIETYKPIVVYIKKARGMMTRFVIRNKIADVENLKAFSEEGYWFNEQLSSENKLVFTRG